VKDLPVNSFSSAAGEAVDFGLVKVYGVTLITLITLITLLALKPLITLVALKTLITLVALKPLITRIVNNLNNPINRNNPFRFLEKYHLSNHNILNNQ